MEKGALLLLLCLQAFLLITTLPSSDAAALLRQDLTPPDCRVDVDLTALERLKIRRPKRRRSGCWWKRGPCSAKMNPRDKPKGPTTSYPRLLVALGKHT
ncbi:hypothetical protein OYC64_018152 [Pagothenia borchgrevinki]|uniref:Uncharacterized protein n=1 Tax=Pagothenia borchgrevinki TaxID=8213 RepID=A0ABD2GNU5_PAGBO